MLSHPFRVWRNHLSRTPGVVRMVWPLSPCGWFLLSEDSFQFGFAELHHHQILPQSGGVLQTQGREHCQTRRYSEGHALAGSVKLLNLFRSEPISIDSYCSQHIPLLPRLAVAVSFRNGFNSHRDRPGPRPNLLSVPSSNSLKSRISCSICSSST